MKLKVLGLLALSAGLSYGAVGLVGTIAGPTDNAGAPLLAGSAALIVVDLGGDGINALADAGTYTVGSLFGGDYVAGIVLSTEVFSSPNLAFDGTTAVSLNLGDGGVAGNENYYAVWFGGIQQPGNTASVTTVGGEQYLSGRDTSWVVPAADGSTPVVNPGTPPFVAGAVIPEPSSALLLGLASLAFLRRRR